MARWDTDWMRRLDHELVELAFQPVHVQQAVRRSLASDPVAFAVIYFAHHLKDRDGHMTWAEVHFAWAQLAEKAFTSVPTEPQEHRHAVIAPRECGKSTWWFLILPMWAAANRHRSFIAAFAHAAAQAEGHLATFKNELDTNVLLRLDYPELCTPARRRSGTSVADRAGMLKCRSGFTFAARGIDTAVLGMKVDEVRPDALIMDDVEPDESNYSADQAVKRLTTVTDSILPLNVYAPVFMIGTVTMPGSLMHQHVKAALGVEIADWIRDEKFSGHYFRAIQTNDDGTERSIWPEKWPLSWLLGFRHTRSFAKNFDNDPMFREGQYWRVEDFQHGEPTLITDNGAVARVPTRWVLAVDPAVTSKKTSDFTGLAVVGLLPEVRRKPSRMEPRGHLLAPSGAVIAFSSGVRLTGQHLKHHVVSTIFSRFPQIREIVIETNQGGDLWVDVFSGIPGVRVRTINSTEPKEVRFATQLEHWQRHRVWHTERFSTLEEQAVGFPNVPYDDVIDAAVIGVQRLLGRPKVAAAPQTESYLGRSA
jgi:hypothetical protein